MLFNSYPFLFGFLPITLAVFFLLGRTQRGWAIPALALASLVFYSYWDWRFVPVFGLSVLTNFAFGRLLAAAPEAQRRGLLLAAVTANLALLGYFKYSNFLLDQLASFVSLAPGDTKGWVLPLGISFFTFTQITYLVDVARGKARESSFWHYLLFVSYFPHLIAGPILHHAQMMPQFSDRNVFEPSATRIAQGLTVFSVGLAKKALLADTLALYASPVFDAAAGGLNPSFVECWTGALAYTLQLYFDFSGYSDMAVGLSLLFNIRLPVNFNSPYRATSIIDFWRRWHISLSTFLRDYLYVPLGGNRKGSLRRYLNLFATMLLGGLWHGAGWTFVLWGALHGAYLVVNHAWRAVAKAFGIEGWGLRWPGRVAAGALTFLCVVVAWVLFRSVSLDAAVRILGGMVGWRGVVLPEALQPVLGSLAPTHVTFGLASEALGLPLLQAWACIVGGLVIVFCLPNVYQWMSRVRLTFEEVVPPATRDGPWTWAGRRQEAWFAGVLFIAALLSLTRVSEFLYFQF